MIKEILKPFDLEKAKAGAKLRASDGRDARIICFDRKFGGRNELIALLTHPICKDEACFSFSEKGIFGNDLYLQIVEEVEEPDRWRDRDEKVIDYIANHEGKIFTLSDSFKYCVSGYATEKEALREYAGRKISHIIANDKRFGGPITYQEWLNDNFKYTIERSRGKICPGLTSYSFTPLAFHTTEQRNLFFEENQDLLKAYFML